MTTTTPQPGVALDKGDPVPASTKDKAKAGLIWGLVPVILSGTVEILRQTGFLFPNAPSWILMTCAAMLLVLGPAASYLGVYLTPNRLLQPVTISGPKDPE